MRRRADQYEVHAAESARNVLDHQAELVLDGRRLDRPVNYLLARIIPPDGTTIDPAKRPFVVVFCSRGDNITPPQQALDWILDRYDSVDDIRAWGQTIVYTMHEHIGHLGIFVSFGVARKEYDEFASNIDLIDVLPHGLYEAVPTPKGEAVDYLDLVTGEWVMRCEARTLDDIRAFGGNDLALYRTFAQPAVRAAVSPPLARAIRRLHPFRLSFEVFGRESVAPRGQASSRKAS